MAISEGAAISRVNMGVGGHSSSSGKATADGGTEGGRNSNTNTSTASNRGSVNTHAGGAGGRSRVRCGYCKKCKGPKPARAHHCHVCDQCIMNVREREIRAVRVSAMPAPCLIRSRCERS